MLNSPVLCETEEREIGGDHSISSRNRSSGNAYQGWDEIDTGHVVDVVDLHVAPDALVPATLDRTLEYVRVVEVLHRLRAKVDAQMLQLARLRILETEHVQDPDEPIRRVPYRVVQRGHASGTGTTCAWHEKTDISRQ